MRACHLGATFDRRANERDVELGDGVQEVVSCIQDPHLLRQPEGTQDEAPGRRMCVWCALFHVRFVPGGHMELVIACKT